MTTIRLPAPKFTATTVLNYSPRKARLVINTIRGVKLSDALVQLQNNGRPKSKKIYHLLKSAANNMALVEGDYSNTVVSTIVAEEAQKLFRMIERGRGSGHKTARRYSRIKVLLTNNNISK